MNKIYLANVKVRINPQIVVIRNVKTHAKTIDEVNIYNLSKLVKGKRNFKLIGLVKKKNNEATFTVETYDFETDLKVVTNHIDLDSIRECKQTKKRILRDLEAFKAKDVSIVKINSKPKYLGDSNI